jgi:hypothetical protein
MSELDIINWNLIYQDLFDRETPPMITKTGTGFKSSIFYLWQYTLSEGVTINGSQSLSRFYLQYPDSGQLESEFAFINFYDNSINISSEKEVLAKLRNYIYGDKSRIEGRNNYSIAGRKVLSHIVDMHYNLLINSQDITEKISIGSSSSEVLDLLKKI